MATDSPRADVMSDVSRTPGTASTDREPSLSELAFEVASIRGRIEGRLNELDRHLMPGSLIERFSQHNQNEGPEMLNRLNEQVRNNPVAAAVTAIGLSWLIGSALRDTEPSRPSRSVSGKAPQLVDDHPVAIGALAMTVGAIIGSVLSLSDREDRCLGERKATVTAGHGSRTS